MENVRIGVVAAAATLTPLGDGLAALERLCFGCGATIRVVAPEAGFRAWLAGAYAQDALGMIGPDEREGCISGTCPACWRELFGDDEEGA